VKRSETKRPLLAPAANQVMSLNRATSLGATQRPVRAVKYDKHLGDQFPSGGPRFEA
jgi:hypothetical protein